MAYIKPSVLVYQELQNAGGVANITPDLGSVIIGPLYNVVRVDLFDADSLTTTLGGESDDLSANSPITNSPYVIFNNKVTVTSSNHELEVGDIVEITGDTATVIPNGTEVVVTEVSRDVFSFNFTADDSTGTPTFDYSLIGLRVNLTGTFPGQLVEQSSVQVFATDAHVKTTQFSANISEAVSLAANFFAGDSTRDEFNFRWSNGGNAYGQAFVPAGAIPEAMLPDNSGKHIALDDKVIIDYRTPNHIYESYAKVASNVVTLDLGTRVSSVFGGNKIYVSTLFGDVTAGFPAIGEKTVTSVDNSNTNHRKIRFAETLPDTPSATGQAFVLATNVVTVTSVAHGLATGDWVEFQNVTGGVITNFTVKGITVIDADTFTVNHTAANTSGTLDYERVIQVRFARLSNYSVTDGEVTVTRNSHGFTAGDIVSVVFESGPGGLNTVNGLGRVVTGVPDANTFKFDVVGVANSTDPDNLINVAKDVTLITKVTKLVKIKNNSGVDIIKGFKISTPIEDFAYQYLLAGSVTVAATIKVYRKYDQLEVPGTVTLDNGVPATQIDYAGLDNDYLVLENTASAYKTLSSTIIPGVDEDSYEILSGKFHVAYRAVRQDKYTTILTLNDTAEIEAALGDVSELNPLALGVSLANSNTTTSVMAVSLKADLVEGVPVFDWDTAMELLENQKEVYAMAPLTQDLAVLSKFKTHVLQMSEPKNAAWRVLICSTEIPDVKYVLSSATQAADPEVALTTGRTKDIGGVLYFSDSAVAGGPDFIEAGVTPGDQLVVTASADADLIRSWTVDEVINGKTLKIVETEFSTPTITVGVSATYYIVRTLTKAMQAEHILATSETFNSNRVWHVQPDIVGVNVRGTVKYLPGYYLCAALSGMTAGFPVQQGFTNISVAGIDDLLHSNFYFKKEQLDATISDKAGTCWFVQDAQGGIPYCRHELTTDNSVLEYREILKVKNWDFLSYYYYEKMRPYIGSWNITDDTLSVMKQVMIAASELLLKQKLPRIGAPLVAYQNPTIEQDAVNKDTTNVTIPVSIVDPNNYTNLYIVI